MSCIDLFAWLLFISFSKSHGNELNDCFSTPINITVAVPLQNPFIVSVSIHITSIPFTYLQTSPSATGTYYPMPYALYISNLTIYNLNKQQNVPYTTTISNTSDTSYIFTPKTTSGHNSHNTDDDSWIITYQIDVSKMQDGFSNIGQTVASSNIFYGSNYHQNSQNKNIALLLAGYGTFLIINGPDGYDYCYYVSVLLDSDSSWQYYVALPRLGHSNSTAAFSDTYIAKNTFLLLDSPIFIGYNITTMLVTHTDQTKPNTNATGYSYETLSKPLLVENFQSQNGFSSQLLSVWNVDYLYNYNVRNLLIAQQNALQCLIDVYSNTSLNSTIFNDDIPYYHVIFELVTPSDNTGWALEHTNSFQCIENATFNQTISKLRISFHMIHHEMHSFFIPRRLYTDKLQPWKQAFILEKSQFVWFGEGFAQYVAYQSLARSCVFNTSEVLLGIMNRFMNSYLYDGPTGNQTYSMFEMSQIMYKNQTFWFYHFSSGALFALYLDHYIWEYKTNGSGLNEALLSLYDNMQIDYPDGIPENEFAVYLENVIQVPNITSLFDIYVAGVTPLPVTEIFAFVGINHTDNGGYTFLNDDEVSTQVALFRQECFSC